MKARVIAYYLPQYHPVEVNDKYWGKGFTEWVNVAKARPLFRGHDEPRIPADLGFYDLRLPEVREEQARLAREAGVEGFCYWHYWFGNGDEVLEKPLDEVVRTKSPDFPFCIGWANHSWTTRTWTNARSSDDGYIFKQEYLGPEEYKRHFLRLLPIFQDERYIKVDGKLLFTIFDIRGFKDFSTFKQVWNELAREYMLPGFYFVAHANTIPVVSAVKSASHKNLEKIAHKAIEDTLATGVDAVETLNLQYAELKTKGLLHKVIGAISRKHLNGFFLEKYDYQKIVENYQVADSVRENVFPEILVGNDRSPRAGRKAIIYDKATPDAFYEGVTRAVEQVSEKDSEHRIIFLNSWNEWGEGSYMEPDQRYGHGFLEALRRALN